MSSDYTFKGWLGKDKLSVQGTMEWEEFEPKTWSEEDVDIEISHCGVCGTDVHTLRSGHGASLYPCVVGHEIIGRAVRVGKKVQHVKVGDRVGVGAQSDSCRKPECPECADGSENLCTEFVVTYAAKYENGDTSYGGFANYNRTPGHFVVKIPDQLDSADAAPMLCAGITVYSPLKRNGCAGKRVGIIGVGGLGHFGILFAKALGASRVVAVSRTSTKKADALKMGADHFIATDESADWATTNAGSLDLIVSTVSSPNMPLTNYLALLATRGLFVQVGAPEDNLPAFSAFALMGKAAKIGGSSIGPPWEMREMLEFAAEKGVKPWIQERKMKDANQAIVDMDRGDARYRYVLVQE